MTVEAGKIGILSAMPQELDAVLEEVKVSDVDPYAGRRFHIGELHGSQVIAASSRVGKTAAALTTTLLTERYGCKAVIFTGVAGAVNEDLSQGDIVVADRLLHHDVDASQAALGFQRYEIPLLGVKELSADPDLSDKAFKAAETFMAAHYNDASRARRGLVISGEQFIGSVETIADLRGRLPDALAVEMEGAAVAQVCYELDIPYAIVRTISDGGNDTAGKDFIGFLEECGEHAKAIVRGIITGG